MSVTGVPSQPGVSLDVMDWRTSAVFLPISRPPSYSDRLPSLSTLAMQPVWPPGQVAV